MKIIYFGLLLASSMAITAGYSAGIARKEIAIFAGGSSLYLEKAFEKIYGVIDAEAGYAGGTTRNPTASNYASGGHAEAVRVTYMPDRVAYGDLLDVFWRNIDPTDAGGQFKDRGIQYRTAVFWLSQDQKNKADASRAALVKSGRFKAQVVTEIAKAPEFYASPSNMQDLAQKKKTADFDKIFAQSGRKDFFLATWGESAFIDPGAPPAAKNGSYKKPSKDELLKKLTRMQFEVTQNEGTEPAFDNEYWNNHEEGIYVDIVSGEPLFSSRDKFESGTGWPSFFLPLEPGNVKFVTDSSFGMLRVEVKSAYADSHLGHLFEDGPEPTGLRYCMDSASLRFIPKSALAKEGYGKYLAYFNH